MLLEMMMAAGLACAELPGLAEEFDSETIDVEAVRTLANKEPDCSRAFVVHGRILMKQGEIDEGIAVFEQAVTHSPDESMLHTWLGRALLSRAGRESSLSDARAAVRSLEKAIALDEMNLDARESLASFHRAAPWIAGGDMDVADEQAEFVMRHDRRRGVQMLAANRVEDGDEDEAIELLRNTLAGNPEWDGLAVQLAIIHHGEKEYANAFKLLSKYADVSEPNPNVIYQLGRTAALSGDFLDAGRQAMQRYIEMLDADPELDVPAAAAWWRLGMIEEHADNVAAARVAYQKALEIDPEYEAARDALNDLD